MRRSALAVGGLIAFLVSAALIYFVVVQYLSQPLGQLYRTISQIVELVPQDWIWATIIALTALVGLRNFSSKRNLAESVDSNVHGQSESLDSWLLVLQERKKGTYFGWRLANRLSELESHFSNHPGRQPSPQIREYLKMGRERRTIGAVETRISGYYDIDAVVKYFERRIEPDYDS